MATKGCEVLDNLIIAALSKFLRWKENKQVPDRELQKPESTGAVLYGKAMAASHSIICWTHVNSTVRGDLGIPIYSPLA